MRRTRQELVDSIRTQKPGISDADAAKLVKDEEQLRALQAAGFAVKVSRVGDSPDLYKLAAELKADPSIPKVPPR